ncbi:DUF6339 family protein [Paenibacillus vini]|uniref:DUF6339 family protein n=1 Tax=Paenibacillus vini TaxID=1476024 RepID=UPI0025B6686A|nr:DUF6339 family protein [Paenibacillus vini]MDN4066667.1 DUF6339 family protein [Paenibacillus vini]
MMEWKVLKKSECEKILSQWTYPDDVKWDASHGFEPIRNRLTDLFQSIKEELAISSPSGKEYAFDFRFGMGMYLILTEEFRISEYQASNDSFWIYLCMKVIPDIVFWRWGSAKNDRFYASSRRIYLKALWWYVHLSWQGSKEKTYRVLEQNTTDEIVQLVERSGPFGYRVDLCRVMMRLYNEYGTGLRGRNNKLFRRAMKLNTARLAVVEPALYEGEEEGYVRELFQELIAN